MWRWSRFISMTSKYRHLILIRFWFATCIRTRFSWSQQLSLYDCLLSQHRTCIFDIWIAKISPTTVALSEPIISLCKFGKASKTADTIARYNIYKALPERLNLHIVVMLHPKTADTLSFLQETQISRYPGMRPLSGALPAILHIPIFSSLFVLLVRHNPQVD